MRLHPLALAPFAAALSVALVLGLALAGCGQKGPLVMPDTDTSSVVIRPSAAPAPPATPAGNTPAQSPAPAAPTGSAAQPASAVPPTPPDGAPRTDDDATPRTDTAPRH